MGEGHCERCGQVVQREELVSLPYIGPSCYNCALHVLSFYIQNAQNLLTSLIEAKKPGQARKEESAG
jgi:hypothetical protein